LVVFSDGWDPKTSNPGYGGRAIARDLVHYGKVVESDEALGTHGTPIKGWLWNPSKVWLEAEMPLDLHLSQEELDKIRAKEKASKLEPGETLKWEQRLATSVAENRVPAPSNFAQVAVELAQRDRGDLLSAVWVNDVEPAKPERKLPRKVVVDRGPLVVPLVKKRILRKGFR
jgi:hypothetical protein